LTLLATMTLGTAPATMTLGTTSCQTLARTPSTPGRPLFPSAASRGVAHALNGKLGKIFFEDT
jgi:hypothetical protein